MKLLINEPPLQVLPSLAKAIGLNEAVIIQQLHYLLEGKHGAEIDGKKWIFNTYEQWQDFFPFWSLDTIKRTFLSLEENRLVMSCQPDSGNRRKYYRIDYDTIVQKCTTMRASCPDGEGKLPSSKGASCPDALCTKTSSKTSSKRSTRNSVSGECASLNGEHGQRKSTDAQIFGNAYGQQYERRSGKKYVFEKKDYIAIAAIVKLAPLQDLANMLDWCWDSSNGFHKNCANNLMLFKSQFNAIQAAFASRQQTPLPPPRQQIRDWTDEPDYGSPGCQPPQLIRDPNDYSQ